MSQSSSQNNFVLTTHQLTRVVDGKLIIADISIQVHWGDILAVVGPSGAGKSSFLRLLNRLDEPTRGTVFVEGRDYREIPPQELRRRLGMVMQLPYLFPGTVAENIRFGPEQRGAVISDEEIESLLERVRLSGYSDREVTNLSGGEAQRISLARTLANAPQILLLDEPTSALDAAARQDVEDLINGIIHQEGLTCIIVTHDLDQASRMAERAMVMEAGQLIRMGPIEEVLHA
ncbi:MAG: phosphate ABC transporter ATP-binding protein [Anaerolineales bacterium]|jgi:putative ABC transport system ATP-binding protein